MVISRIYLNKEEKNLTKTSQTQKSKINKFFPKKSLHFEHIIQNTRLIK